jgi:hypothetical protein
MLGERSECADRQKEERPNGRNRAEEQAAECEGIPAHGYKTKGRTFLHAEKEAAIAIAATIGR